MTASLQEFTDVQLAGSSSKQEHQPNMPLTFILEVLPSLIDESRSRAGVPNFEDGMLGISDVLIKQC